MVNKSISELIGPAEKNKVMFALSIRDQGTTHQK